MKRLACSIVVLMVFIFSVSFSGQAYAHTEIHVGDVTIEAGWENEPPLVGELNSVLLEFNKESKPLVIDPRSMTVQVKYGGVVKTIDIEPKPLPLLTKTAPSAKRSTAAPFAPF